MAQTSNFNWAQGEDLSISLIYKEGPVNSEVVIDLSIGYQVRMDIVIPSTKERIYTFNTASIADVDPLLVGAQPDSVLEGVLSSGAAGSSNIDIAVSRNLTLPGGTVYAKMTGSPAVAVFAYDIFLRKVSSDKQAKILTGTITVEESNTLWL